MTLEEMIAKKKATTRKRPSDEEHRIQCSCVRWFNLKHRKLKGRRCAGPNGGKRDALTGAKLKAEGVVAGVADLILLVPNRFYGALLVEMKTLTGRQSKSQKDWEQIITSEGDYKYVVCHSLDDFIREVDDYIKYCD